MKKAAKYSLSVDGETILNNCDMSTVMHFINTLKESAYKSIFIRHSGDTGHEKS